jgi:hypothetical protein
LVAPRPLDPDAAIAYLRARVPVIAVIVVALLVVLLFHLALYP